MIQSDLSCDNSFELGVQGQERYVWCSGGSRGTSSLQSLPVGGSKRAGIIPSHHGTMYVHVHIHCVCVCQL